MTIPADRLRKAVDEWKNYKKGIDPEKRYGPKPAIGIAADFAARLLVLEPLWRKAREVLRETQFKFDEFAGVVVCSSCGNFRRNGCAPDCAIAELLREE